MTMAGRMPDNRDRCEDFFGKIDVIDVVDAIGLIDTLGTAYFVAVLQQHTEHLHFGRFAVLHSSVQVSGAGLVIFKYFC